MSIEIITGSCVGFDSTGVDSMITDPPYSAHVHKNATSQSAGGGTRFRDLGFDHLTPELRDAIAEFAARAKKWSVVYSDVEGLHDWRMTAVAKGATYIRPIPWVRWSMPQLSGDRPPTGCEFITAFWGSQKGRKHWNGPGSLTHLAHTCLRGEDKHKCEKPLDQLLDLVSWFTDPDDLVFDPCVGAGTTALACRLLGRSFVGFEIDASWAEKARARVEAPTLSDRDRERYERWVRSKAEQDAAAEEREKINQKARAKNDAAKKAKGDGDGVA